MKTSSKLQHIFLQILKVKKKNQSYIETEKLKAAKTIPSNNSAA